MARILYLHDLNSDIWKDPFLAGLPSGFTNMVRNKIGNVNLGEFRVVQCSVESLR